MAKRLNPNLVKIHRSYTVEEVARLLSVHKNTVRSWLKSGLPTSDDRRPVLILGSVLKQYLVDKKQVNKRPCKLSEIYCLRCKIPQFPAGGMVDYEPLNANSGRLIALCPQCDCVINKYFKSVNLARLSNKLDITYTKTLKDINESVHPLLNSDFKQ